MSKLNPTSLNETDSFAQSIGHVIWAMGQLEFLLYDWCFHLGGESLRDLAIEKRGFGARYKILVKAISDSSLPDDKRRDALSLWERAKEFSGFRDIVAHSPVVTNRQNGQVGIVNARDLCGCGRRQVSALLPDALFEEAKLMQNLAFLLDWDIREFHRGAVIPPNDSFIGKDHKLPPNT